MNSDYMSSFAKRYPKEEILKYISNVQKLDVLVVGEAIIDEYRYCRAIGKSAKEPMLALKFLTTEKFDGGSHAIAEHLESFCDNVEVISSAPAIIKQRFIDSYSFAKLLEIYEIAELNEYIHSELRRWIQDALSQYHIAIVADFGHGMLDAGAVDILCEKAGFLAVNTQANADNWGCHTISRYWRADYICIGEQELWLEVRDRYGDLEKMILDVSRRIGCERIVITRGSMGCLCYDAHGGFFEIPSFAARVVDRMGAGDTFLAISSLVAAQAAPIEVVGFIGNVAGALSVEIVGHRKYLTKEALITRIESLYD